MPAILTIGEVLIDLTQVSTTAGDIPLLAANPGGAPANVAVAAARLGASTGFIGKVGRDSFGRLLVRVLQQDGVDVSGVRTDTAPTTMAIVTVSPEGERSFRFVRGADKNLTAEEISPRQLEGCKILHFGSVSLSAAPVRSATLTAVRQARALGKLVSYDPNYRDALWDDKEDAIEWMKTPLDMVDILKISDEELPLMTGTTDPEEGSRLLADKGIQLVMITLGASGVFYRWQGKSGQVPGVPTRIADTNGAGDTFLGAVLSRLTARGKAPLEELSAAELEKILFFANRAASKTCSRSGAIPAMPTLEELKDGEDSE